MDSCESREADVHPQSLTLCKDLGRKWPLTSSNSHVHTDTTSSFFTPIQLLDRTEVGPAPRIIRNTSESVLQPPGGRSCGSIPKMLRALDAQENHMLPACGHSSPSPRGGLTEFTERPDDQACRGPLRILAIRPGEDAHATHALSRLGDGSSGRPDNFDGGTAEKPEIRSAMDQCAASLGPVTFSSP